MCIKFFFQQHIHEKILNTFFINLHTNCIFLNLKLVQLNLNPIVELELNLELIKFKSNFLFEFKYIEWISILYRKELVFFTPWTTFGEKTCSTIFVVSLVQIKRIYCMWHIASYHHYSKLAKIYLSQGYFHIWYHWHMNMKWVFYGWAWKYFFSFIVIVLI